MVINQHEMCARSPCEEVFCQAEAQNAMKLLRQKRVQMQVLIFAPLLLNPLKKRNDASIERTSCNSFHVTYFPNIIPSCPCITVKHGGRRLCFLNPQNIRCSIILTWIVNTWGMCKYLRTFVENQRGRVVICHRHANIFPSMTISEKTPTDSKSFLSLRKYLYL